MYAANKQEDSILNDLKVDQIQDDYQRKQCYAPLQIWPVYDTLSKQVVLPPPPNIPAILQTFLTQIYSTGDILD